MTGRLALGRVSIVRLLLSLTDPDPGPCVTIIMPQYHQSLTPRRPASSTILGRTLRLDRPMQTPLMRFRSGIPRMQRVRATKVFNCLTNSKYDNESKHRLHASLLCGLRGVSHAILETSR